MEVTARWNSSWEKGEVSVSEGNTLISVDWLSKEECETLALKFKEAYLELSQNNLLECLDDLKHLIVQEDSDMGEIKEALAKVYIAVEK